MRKMANKFWKRRNRVHSKDGEDLQAYKNEVNDGLVLITIFFILKLFAGRLKKISTCCLESSGENLLIGTEGGNIYLLDVKSFDVSNNIIYQDVVMQK